MLSVDLSEMKQVEGFPMYYVTRDGKVYSLFSHKFLRSNIQRNGYHTVELFNENGSKRVLIHRLVAKAYVPNPNCYPVVNHLDESKDNNNAENLEWTTHRANLMYGTAPARRRAHTDYSTQNRKDAARRNGRKVWRRVRNVDTGEVFDSIKLAASHYRISFSHIGECCRGSKYETVGGYHWEYA